MEKDMTKGSPMRLILGFAVPLMFGLLFQQFYSMVDAIIVGHYLGVDALAAVGATGSVNFLIIGFCMGVCSGFAIPVAQEFGARHEENLRKYVANCVWLSLIFAAVMTVLVSALCRVILQVMRTPGNIIDQSYAYIFIIFLGIPVTYLYNMTAAILRSLGDSRTPVYFLALSSILNIFLDVALILWFHMGVAGAAVATVASQAVSGLACLWTVKRRFPILHVSRDEIRFDGKCGRDLCVMGVPMGLQYSVTAIGSIVLQSAVNGLGSLYVAATAAGGKLSCFLACPFDAMGAAMATYCGQNVGAGKLDRLGRGIRDCALLGLVYAAAAFGAMLAFAPDCAMWFIDENGGEDTALLVDLVSRYILMCTGFYFPLALVNIVRFSIQGMGYSVLAILSGALEMIARAVVGSLFVPRFGFAAACWASPAAWMCADLFLIPACLLCVRRLRRHKSQFEHYQRAVREAEDRPVLRRDRRSLVAMPRLLHRTRRRDFHKAS